MTKSLRYFSLATGLSLLAACADLSGPEHQLTDAEAAFLAQEFAGAALDGVNTSMQGSPGLSPSASATSDDRPWGPVTWERTFTITRTCRAGGTVTNSGSNQGSLDSTHTGTIEISHILAMDDCARTRDSVTITVNTDPDLTMTGTITIENGQKTGGEFTKTGVFLWETSDGRSGSCEVNLTITWTGDDDWHHEGSHSVGGTMCGRDISRLGGFGRKG
jgi:hypothetical protein